MSHPRIEEYLAIARGCRGTEAAAAIIGLIAWVEDLAKQLDPPSFRHHEALEELLRNGALTDCLMPKGSGERQC